MCAKGLSFSISEMAAILSAGMHDSRIEQDCEAQRKVTAMLYESSRNDPGLFSFLPSTALSALYPPSIVSIENIRFKRDRIEVKMPCVPVSG
jgi:hypothetical protein